MRKDQLQAAHTEPLSGAELRSSPRHLSAAHSRPTPAHLPAGRTHPAAHSLPAAGMLIAIIAHRSSAASSECAWYFVAYTFDTTLVSRDTPSGQGGGFVSGWAGR